MRRSSQPEVMSRASTTLIWSRGQGRFGAHAGEHRIVDKMPQGPRQRMVAIISWEKHQESLPTPFVSAESLSGILLFRTSQAPAAAPAPRSVSAVATGCICASRNKLDVRRPRGEAHIPSTLHNSPCKAAGAKAARPLRAGPPREPLSSVPGTRRKLRIVDAPRHSAERRDNLV